MKKIIIFLFINLFAFNLIAQLNHKDSGLNLMPWPKSVQIKGGYFKIDENFSIKVLNNSKHTNKIYNASTQFLRNLSNKTGVFINQGFVTVATQSNNPSLVVSFIEATDVKLGIDESYSLSVSKSQIKISAKTDVGAMHALNTLLQLLTVNNGQYMFPSVSIEDSPRFQWRGLMIDAARHFMPVDVIKRNLNAMAYVKLNVFHWHLSDDQGFRVESKKLPLLTQKANDGQYYTQNQIKDVVKYASDRGIRVIPEIDVPGHASAFLTAYPEISSKDTIYQIERYAGIFNPTLDPTNEKTYEILDVLFSELTALFPDEYFHIGGDENAGKHWNENKGIQKFMKENKIKNNHELQTYFNIKLEKILNKYNKKLMGWDEILTPNMPTTAVIHSWRGKNEGLAQSTLIEAAKKGYKTVLSNGFYIDRMQSVEKHYATEPIGDVVLSDQERNNILGGEVTMWAELVTPLTIDSRIWPRTAAIAERFWSPKNITNIDSMFKRMDVINGDLELLGVTHMRNKQLILRNIANQQDTEALNELSNISEPFKIYSRNNGGKEYKSYSPFTLFADACNVDAKDALRFNFLVNKYLIDQDESIKNELLEYFNSWKNIDNKIQLLRTNAPIIETILPYANRVSKISDIFYKGLQSNHLSKLQFEEVKDLLESKENPKDNLDVNLAISGSLTKLADFLAKN